MLQYIPWGLAIALVHCIRGDRGTGISILAAYVPLQSPRELVISNLNPLSVCTVQLHIR
jgi:hypothetical protein